jgi:hypothetical protein
VSAWLRLRQLAAVARTAAASSAPATFDDKTAFGFPSDQFAPERLRDFKLRSPEDYADSPGFHHEGVKIVAASGAGFASSISRPTAPAAMPSPRPTSITRRTSRGCARSITKLLANETKLPAESHGGG